MTPEDRNEHGSTPAVSATEPDPAQAIHEAAQQFQEAATAKKCWPCGCLHDSLVSIERAFAESALPEELSEAMRAARARRTERRYDCLGCSICYPALAINALNPIAGERAVELTPCPTESVVERPGWPPLPGNYTVLRYRAPVAICTLTSDDLRERVVQQAGPEVALVGSLQTENLGMERLITNVIANPHIRFLIVCGADSRQAVGHLPGQSLLALAQNGLDERGRIVGAQGRRPVLRNVPQAAVEHFRKTIEVVNLVGRTDIQALLESAQVCADRYPGPTEPLAHTEWMTAIKGSIPERMTSDPAGYFVIYVDRAQGSLAMEHYRNDGVLNALIEGHTAAELYFPAIERGLVSRLDHAAYLGRELARAEHALQSGVVYLQDAAPERILSLPQMGACGCGSTCQEEFQ